MAPEGHGACPGQHNRDRQGLTKVIKLHLKMMGFLMPPLAIMGWSCKPCKKKTPLAVFGLFATTHIGGDNTEEQSNLYLVTWAEEMPTCQHPARQKCLGSHIPTSADICSMHIWLQLPLVLIWLSAPLKQVASATCLAKPKLPLGKLKGVQKEKDKVIEFLHALALRHLPLKPIAALTFQPL